MKLLELALYEFKYRWEHRKEAGDLVNVYENQGCCAESMHDFLFPSYVEFMWPPMKGKDVYVYYTQADTETFYRIGNLFLRYGYTADAKKRGLTKSAIGWELGAVLNKYGIPHQYDGGIAVISVPDQICGMGVDDVDSDDTTK